MLIALGDRKGGVAVFVNGAAGGQVVDPTSAAIAIHSGAQAVVAMATKVLFDDVENRHLWFVFGCLGPPLMPIGDLLVGQNEIIGVPTHRAGRYLGCAAVKRD